MQWEVGQSVDSSRDALFLCDFVITSNEFSEMKLKDHSKKIAEETLVFLHCLLLVLQLFHRSCSLFVLFFDSTSCNLVCCSCRFSFSRMGNKDVGGWLMQISFENFSIVNLFLCVWVTQSQLNTLGYRFCRQSLRYCLRLLKSHFSSCRLGL